MKSQRDNHTTAYELEFLDRLHAKNPEAFKLQAALILGNQRRYDPEIAVGVIHLHVRRLLKTATGDRMPWPESYGSVCVSPQSAMAHLNSSIPLRPRRNLMGEG